VVAAAAVVVVAAATTEPADASRPARLKARAGRRG